MKGTTNGSWQSRFRGKSGRRWPEWVLPAVLLVLSVICASVVLLADRIGGRPLTLPVDLMLGVTRSPEFRVFREVRYVVLLEVDRNVSLNTLECQPGVPPYRPPCSVDPVVDVHWTLWSGSQEIASGSSRNAGWASGPTKASLHIGQFEGTFGRKYVLDLVSNADGSVLAAANPRIAVRFHPEVTKGHHIFAPLIAVLALAIGSIPAAILALGALASPPRS